MLRVLALSLVLASLCSGALAAEEIQAFHARIELTSDDTMRVTEQITVNAEGKQIRRGIFRDILLRYENASSQVREIWLNVAGVTRNGHPEPFTVERNPNASRIRIGDPRRFVQRAFHVYEIVYETADQVRFFVDHDELYWNVTDNGREFPSCKRADIRLPDGAAATAVTYFVVSMLAANVGRALRRARTLEQRVGAVAAFGGAGAVALIGFTGSTGLLSGVRVDTGLVRCSRTRIESDKSGIGQHRQCARRPLHDLVARRESVVIGLFR